MTRHPFIGVTQTPLERVVNQCTPLTACGVADTFAPPIQLPLHELRTIAHTEVVHSHSTHAYADVESGCLEH